MCRTIPDTMAALLWCAAGVPAMLDGERWCAAGVSNNLLGVLRPTGSGVTLM